MARSSSGFDFPVDFMTEEDRLKIAERISAVSPDWCKVEWIYNANSEYEWDRNKLFIEESGIWLSDIEDMMDYYIAFVLKHYPEAECTGCAHYTQLNAEGQYYWSFEIKNGVATVNYISNPLDCPHCWCPECEEEIDNYYTDNITVDNYMDYTYTCPNCGYVIKPYEDYNYTVEKWGCSVEDLEDYIDEE